MKKQNVFIRPLLAWLCVALVAIPLVLARAAVLPVTTQGNIYHVATDGTDAPGCGTETSPCRSIQYAANLVAAGDTVLINPGTYDGGITVDSSGTEGEPITFRADGSGVVVNGSGGERDAFFITEADYIVVQGLTIQNATRAGVRISLSDHVTVRDCTLADNGTWGLFTDFSDYTTVENCESYGALDEHGIYISNSSDYPTIRHNHLHHNHGCGLHMNGDISMGGDGIISHALVEGNVIYENGAGGGSGINMDGVTDSLVRNNLLYDNHASGISVYQIDGGSGSHDNRLLNNTIIMASDGRWGINIPNTNDTNNKLFNNIVYNWHSWRGCIAIAAPALAGFESDYNVVMDRFSSDTGDTRITLAEWRALGYDAHSIIATPSELFVDEAADDYHLKPGSPAIDQGTLLADVTDDLEGNPRPSGATHDAGAYEYQDDVFSLTANPTTRRILPGGVATYTLSLQPTGNFTGVVALAAASPAPELVLSLVPTAVAPPGQATLTVSDTHTGTMSPAVSYTISITATGGGVTRAASVNLLVGDDAETLVFLPLALRSTAPSGPQFEGCQVFPGDHIWNTPIDTLPVDANSAAYINTIGYDTGLHADFGSGTWDGFAIGIPFVTVPGTQATSSVTFQYADESDPGPYPIPANPPIEGDPDGDGDRHILIVDRDNCVLYELYAAHLETDGWYAGSGAIFDLHSYDLRPDGWTSADAAGLPILPGLVRYDEVAAGEIRHAIRFTANQTRRAYVWPARHYASSLTGSQYPPLGQRFRLRADFDVSGFSPGVQVILQAFKTYGIILADNGSDWYISGAPDERWDNDVLHELDQVQGSDFEAVDVSSLMIDPDSGQAQP